MVHSVGMRQPSLPEMMRQLIGAPSVSSVSPDWDQSNAQVIDHLADWCATHPAQTIIDTLEAERVPVGLIYNVEDQLADPHFNARGMFEDVEVNGKTLQIPAIMPKLTETPGRTDWPGLEVGSHNQEILGDLLGLSPTEIADLQN